jgi:hypothetical protein
MCVGVIDAGVVAACPRLPDRISLVPRPPTTPPPHPRLPSCPSPTQSWVVVGVCAGGIALACVAWVVGALWAYPQSRRHKRASSHLQLGTLDTPLQPRGAWDAVGPSAATAGDGSFLRTNPLLMAATGAGLAVAVSPAGPTPGIARPSLGMYAASSRKASRRSLRLPAGGLELAPLGAGLGLLPASLVSPSSPATVPATATAAVPAAAAAAAVPVPAVAGSTVPWVAVGARAPVRSGGREEGGSPSSPRAAPSSPQAAPSSPRAGGGSGRFVLRQPSAAMLGEGTRSRFGGLTPVRADHRGTSGS